MSVPSELSIPRVIAASAVAARRTYGGWQVSKVDTHVDYLTLSLRGKN